MTKQKSNALEYSYRSCSSCRTSHLHPQPTRDYLGEFYKKFHLSAGEGGVFGDFEDRMSLDFPAKARMVADFLGFSNTKVVGDVRVLDVGCGKGFFVGELLSMGVHAYGVDLAENAVKLGNQRLDSVVLRSGELSDQYDWFGAFDAVTSFATIEHVTEPEAFLRSIYKMLKPGGLLFLDTGLAGDFVERWAPGLVQWFDWPQHLFVFSKKGLVILLERTGFRVIHCDTNYERTRMRKQLKRWRNCLLALSGTSLFRILLGKCAFERMKMESKMPFGSLIFMVAQKVEK